MKDIMLDLETLGTKPDAVIITAGAIKFDPYSDNIQSESDGLYMRLEVDPQLELGRTIDEDTIAWWGKQAEDVRNEALGDENRRSLEEFTTQLNRFLVGCENIWAQGPVFDIVMLENLYRQLGLPVPWNFWQIRDSRTLFGVHGDPRKKGRSGHHNALQDCIHQAQAVQTVYRTNSIVKENPWK